MNCSVKILIGLLIFFYGGILNAQSIEPPVSKKFPYQIAIIMDGGTFYIKEKRTKTTPEKEYTIDGRVNSPSKGELFQGGHSFESSISKRLLRDAALKIFDNIENQLLKFHGKVKFEEIKKNPIQVDDMTDDEAEKKAENPQFNDAMATQLILEKISEYKNNSALGMKTK